MGLSATVEQAMAVLERLRTLAAGEDRAELDARIDELADRLAAVRGEAGGLEERLAALEAENRALKRAGGGSDEPAAVKSGCYQFAGDDALYCPLCWDNQRHKARTTRITSRQRVCSNCRSPISA